MKQVKRITTANTAAIHTAIAATLDIFDGRFELTSLKGFAAHGATVTDTQTGATNGMGVYTAGGDFFATPDFALDWADGEWSGVSANGQAFTIVDCMPAIEVI